MKIQSVGMVMFDGLFISKKMFYFGFGACSFLLFLPGIFSYDGSKWCYLLFSLSFFSLLVSALYTKMSYSYLFLSVFLWLGFWLKLTVHNIFKYPYRESIGSFIQTAESIDEVLLVASVGCWGVIVAAHFLYASRLNSTIFVNQLKVGIVPSIYQKNRKGIIFCLFLSIFGISLLNFYWGVFQIGIIPIKILIWPLNALMSWLLGIGFALIVSTVLWWEIQQEKRVTKTFIASLSEPFFTSVSIFSRSVYLFHVVSIFFAFFYNKSKLRLEVKSSHLVFVIILSAVLFLISFKGVIWLRDYHYSGVVPETNYSELEPSVSTNVDKSGILQTIKILVVDRWLGVEGIMAVSAYPGKNLGLLSEGFFEERIYSKSSIYQKISNSKYPSVYRKRYAFTTIPGAIAFFYYSGSLLIIFLGMFLLTMLMILSEQLIYFLTCNVFFCAVFGIDVANTVAQFGLAPEAMLKHYYLIFAYGLFLYVLQSEKLAYFNMKGASYFYWLRRAKT